MNTLITKNFKAGAAIAAYTPVKFGADDVTVLPATAATDFVIGVTTALPAAIGERVDVVISGLAEVYAGAAVTRGALLTADATSRAITAAPAAGTNHRIMGTAFASGAAGDVIPVLLAPVSFQG